MSAATHTALDQLVEESNLDTEGFDEEPPRRSWMRRGIFALVILAVLGAAWYFLGGRSSGAATGPKQYRIAKATTGTVRKTVSASGTLEAWSVVDIKSRAGGRVDVLAVNVGDTVKTNQVIARIDPADSQLSVQQSQADVDSARSRENQGKYQYDLQVKQSEIAIENARAQLVSAQANLKAAQARLTTAQQQSEVQPEITRTAIANVQAALEQAVSQREQLNATTEQQRASAKAAYDQAVANQQNAKLTVERQKSLLAQGFVSQQTVDTAAATQAVNDAQVASAKAKLDTLATELQTSLLAADARVAQAKASLEQARTGQVDIQSRRNAVREAEASVKQMQAQVRQSQASLNQAIANRANNAIRREDIISARASGARSKATLSNAKTILEQTTVRSPSDGVVLQKYVEQGTIITSGLSLNAAGTSIVQIGDTSRMYVDVAVDETDIASVDEGQEVEVSIEAYSGIPFEGKVIRVNPLAEVEQNVTTVHVRVEIDNTQATFRLLKPGMNATCEFVIGKETDVLTVPKEAVKEDDQGRYVEVAEGGTPAPADPATGTAADPNLKLGVLIKRQPVEVGLEGNDTTQIVSGLTADTPVVVQIIEPEAGPAPGAAGGSPFGRMPGMPRR